MLYVSLLIFFSPNASIDTLLKQNIIHLTTRNRAEIQKYGSKMEEMGVNIYYIEKEKEYFVYAKIVYMKMDGN